MLNKSDTKLVQGRHFPVGGFLDPGVLKEIAKIIDAILLLQNADDNNVNAKVSTSWYNLIKKILGNTVPIQVLHTQQGNEVDQVDLPNKGHYEPTNPADFNRYVQTVADFILKGPSKLPAVSDWLNYDQSIRSNKYFTSASLRQRFISIAFRMYKDNPQELLNCKRPENASKKQSQSLASG